MRRLQLLIVSFVISFCSLGIGLAPLAAAASLQQDACSGLDQVDSSQGCSASGKGVNGLATEAVSIISWLAGIIAVIMILLAGINYMTAGGDASKAANARNALFAAMIGVAIAALAQFFVHFALHASNVAQ